MRDELQRYLDGELSRDELPDELLAEADRWDDVLTSARSLDPGAGADAPPWLRARIREAVAEARPPGTPWWQEAWGWLTRPRTIRISPLGSAAALAAVVAAVLLLVPGAPGTGGNGPPVEASGRVAVQFTLEAPEARSVSLAGDFSGWEPAAQLTDADGDGIWTGRFVLPPGVHQYMFVVNGEEWVTDPRAERYVDDGFGRRNAVLALAPAGDQPS